MEDKKLNGLVINIEAEIKKDNNHKDNIRRWIGTYLGKVIAFQTDDESFYFIFRSDGNFEIQKGEYPSCDAFLKGSYKDVENILLGKKDSKKLINQSVILFYGNYNELISFQGLFHLQSG
jgi:hypothetical protein